MPETANNVINSVLCPSVFTVGDFTAVGFSFCLLQLDGSLFSLSKLPKCCAG